MPADAADDADGQAGLSDVLSISRVQHLHPMCAVLIRQIEESGTVVGQFEPVDVPRLARDLLEGPIAQPELVELLKLALTIGAEKHIALVCRKKAGAVR